MICIRIMSICKNKKKKQLLFYILFISKKFILKITIFVICLNKLTILRIDIKAILNVRFPSEILNVIVGHFLQKKN